MGKSLGLENIDLSYSKIPRPLEQGIDFRKLWTVTFLFALTRTDNFYMQMPESGESSEVFPQQIPRYAVYILYSLSFWVDQFNFIAGKTGSIRLSF